MCQPDRRRLLPRRRQTPEHRAVFDLLRPPPQQIGSSADAEPHQSALVRLAYAILSGIAQAKPAVL